MLTSSEISDATKMQDFNRKKQCCFTPSNHFEFSPLLKVSQIFLKKKVLMLLDHKSIFLATFNFNHAYLS